MKNNIPETVSNEELLVRYRNLDFDAFDEFFERTHKIIFNFILSKLRHWADAEEAFQETYFRVHNYILTYNPEKKAIVWLFAVARNALADTARERQRSKSLPSEFILRTSSGQEDFLRSREAVEDLLQTLSSEDRILIEKRFINEEGYDEIALAYDTKSENARQKISRIIKRLKIGTKI